ncbi:MAG TPA: hypothetical protein ENI92_08100 [Bacteroidetes bacterium]|nr:hypothetical protein [Bacteroidota bacterium]
MKRVASGLVVLLLLSLIIAAGCRRAARTDKNVETEPLARLEAEMDSLLGDLDRDLSGAAHELAARGIKGDSARRVLERLSAKHPFVLDCCSFDSTGSLVQSAPRGHHRLPDEGVQIPNRESLAEMRRTGQPSLGRLFRFLDGTTGVDMNQPILSSEGEFLGTVGFVIEADELMANLRRRAFPEGKVDAWAAEASSGSIIGGGVLREPGEQGAGGAKQDSGWIAFVEALAASPSGSGSYEFFEPDSGRLVRKQVSWSTIRVHRRDWRIGVTMAETQGEGTQQ